SARPTCRSSPRSTRSSATMRSRPSTSGAAASRWRRRPPWPAIRADASAAVDVQVALRALDEAVLGLHGEELEDVGGPLRAPLREKPDGLDVGDGYVPAAVAVADVPHGRAELLVADRRVDVVARGPQPGSRVPSGGAHRFDGA